MRSPLAYRPRSRPLQLATPAATVSFLGSLALVAFVFSDPILLLAVSAAACLAGILAGVGGAVRFAAKIGLTLALLLVLINGLVVSRGATVILRLGEWPLFGPVDVTLEALAAGAVIGLRAVAVMILAAVYSAAVDPDRVLRALRPWLGRSAMTAGLASRLLPLALDDARRLGEAARLRGPSAAPAGRGPLARRLLAGSLDRAVDVAATLELRGYALSGPTPGRVWPRLRHRIRAGRRTIRDHRSLPPRSRFDRRFWLAAFLITAATVVARLAGIGGFDVYPTVEFALGPANLALACAVALAGLVPLRTSGRSGWRRS